MLRRMRVLRSAWGPVPWLASHLSTVKLPPHGDPQYHKLGHAIIAKMQLYDAGPATYHECLVARRQLETILHSCGYELDVMFFGGLVSLGFFEAAGDLDLVGVGDMEPRHEEAAAIVQRVAREMRRLGLRPMAIPRARVPVIRCDRTSVVLPGTPLPPEASCVTFPFSRPLTAEEKDLFDARMVDKLNASELVWREDFQCVCVTFRDTWNAVNAMSTVKRHGDVDIPIRAPLDAKLGPELYRFPFDMCFGTTGMQNTFLMRSALMAYPGSRHLLLALKKWGKACGNINSMDGFLASYAYTSMINHFLIQTGRIEPLRAEEMMTEPHLLPKEPTYVPLETVDQLDVGDVGYLFAHFIAYYANVFDYKNDVVCTTCMKMTKEQLKWPDEPEDGSGRPPFHHFAMKDPFGPDNIARAVDGNRLRFVRESFTMALHVLECESGNFDFALDHLLDDPPKPDAKEASGGFDVEDARRLLVKKHFKGAKKRQDDFGHAVSENKRTTMIATDITQSVVGWLGNKKK